MTPAEAGATIAAALWLTAVVPVSLRLLRALQMVRPNFRGDKVPAGAGIAVILWSCPVLLAWPPAPRDGSPDAALMALSLCAFGALGFVDDRWGDRSATGLRGHFRRLLCERRLTTGAAKALGGVMAGVWVARAGLGLPPGDALLCGAVVALCANALNLLDLRPGRAGAAFLLLSTPLVAATWSASGPPALALVWLPAMALYAWDRRGLAMMGDTGSNALGAVLGLCYCAAVGRTWHVAALLALLFLHVLAERWSLSAMIEQSPLLRRLDRWTGTREPAPESRPRV